MMTEYEKTWEWGMKIPPGRWTETFTVKYKKALEEERKRPLNVSQKKEIVQLHLENKDLGCRKLVELVSARLDLTVTRYQVRKLIKDKDAIVDMQSPKERIGKTIGMQRFRAHLAELILEEQATKKRVTNDDMVYIARKTADLDEWKKWDDIARLEFSHSWILHLKKEFDIPYQKRPGRRLKTNA